MINRRRFLTYGLGMGAAGIAAACNKTAANGDHSMHGQPSAASSSMSHHNMDHSGHQMGGMNHATNADDLLPVSALSTGAALAALPLLANESTQAGKFTGRLVAKKHSLKLAKGLESEFWLYNGVLGGPQIVVYEGDEVSIHFTNELEQETTVHWHGLPVPPEQDGNPHDPVKPGQSLTYTFKLPQGCAGTYWYHTHAHEFSAEQAFRGLAGTFIVKSRQDPMADWAEQHWLFSDLRLDKQGKIPDNTMMDWMNGREGQFVLLNGQLQPKISIKEATRIRVWNVCNARYLKLHIPDCDIIVIGTDGGLLETPQAPVSELLIVPAERYEIVLKPRKTGQLTLQNLPYNREKMMEEFKPVTTVLANIVYTASDKAVPAKLRTLPKLGKPTTEHTVGFSEEMGAQMKQMFKVNGKTFDMQRIDLTSKLGATEDWLVSNASHMDHPFHLHGIQFEIIEFIDSAESSKPAYRSLKDTVNLKPYQSVRVRCRQDFAGLRMFHCHILEHESLGMMGQVMVKA